MEEKYLRNYAKLLAVKGVNVQPGQEVWVYADLDQPEFVAMVVEELYRAGAKRVVTQFSYDAIERLNINCQSLETLAEVSSWEEAKLKYQTEVLPARLYIESSDPDGMKGVDQEKNGKAMQIRYPVIKPYRTAIENKHQWCIAAVPGKKWAAKVFPEFEGDEEAAVEEMWEVILRCARAYNDDPCAAWDAHNAELAERCKWLNDRRFVSLEYKSANGTDFKVGLMEESRFAGGGESTLSGNYFNPNIPSEEVFTSPKKGAAEGIVYATKPLFYRGELIEDFSVRFEGGKVAEVKAKRGEELLKQMVAMDEGASMLGECALIAYHSPISNANILFYNTLFDENASCHLALGRGFPDCIEGFEHRTKEEMEALGLNDSMIHVDFMIGSEDMSIVGVTKEGERIEIFRDGDWAF